MMKRRWPAVMLAVVLLLSSQMVSAVADGLDKTCVDGGEELLLEYFTVSQIRDIRNYVYEWVDDVAAVTSLIRDHGKEMEGTLEKCGITRVEAEAFLLEKLGVRNNFWDKIGNTRADLQIVARGKEGEIVVLHYRVNLGYNAFREASPFWGVATLECVVSARGEDRRMAVVEILD